MPKIKITRATVCGGQHVAVGAMVDASDTDARYLCAIGKAELGDAADTDAELGDAADTDAADKKAARRTKST